MPSTVDAAFRSFLTTLTPYDVESAQARSHRASIEACLTSHFGMRLFFRTGSFGNGTSISGYSDVDYFAVLPTERLKRDSRKTLTAVRDVLHNRFPLTGVRIDCPAVKLPFGPTAADNTEIVPADAVGLTASNELIYDIPDCSGGWMRSSPESHNAYIRTLDGRLGGKVKPLIRFVKAWKCFNDVPISSFYIEMFVAQYLTPENLIVYDIDLNRIFSRLYWEDLPPVNDPLNISGVIHPTSCVTDFADAKEKILTAEVRARFSREASEKGSTSDAFYWWNLLYDGRFPRYTP